MTIEVKTDDEFFELYLALLNDHPNTKMIAAIDAHGAPIGRLKMAWNATVAEEQGFDPIMAMISSDVPYFIMVSKRTKLTGYLYFNPINQ